MKMLYESLETLETREDFERFMKLLLEDFEKNNRDWENRTLSSYLEALGGWIGDLDGVYENRGEPIPEKIDWQFFARALLAATIYE